MKTPFCPFSPLRITVYVFAMASLLSRIITVAHAASPGADLFADDRVTKIEIEVAPGDIEDMERTQKFKGMGERKSYAVTVREAGETYSQVAMHLKGAIGSFRTIDKNPALTLNFDKHLAKQRFHGLEKVSLNNSVQDSARVSERFVREFYRQIGIPAPRVGFATVTLNGRDLGVYLLVEGYNRQFIKQHFKNADGNLYDGGLGEEIDTEGNQPVNSGRNPKDQAHLKQLVATADEPDFTARLARLQQVLDVDRFISLTALDVMIGNWDGYAIGRNNYRIFDDLNVGRLVFLPHGLDQTFQNPEANILPRMPGIIARALLETPEGRRRYLDRMGQLTEKLFDVATMTNRVHQLAATPWRELNVRDPKLGKEHEQAVAAYCANIAQRAASVRRQLDGARQPLRFDAQGSAIVEGWTPATDFGSPTFGEKNLAAAPLQIRADRGTAIASWRVKIWLEKGRYRFEGRVKTTGLVAASGDPRGGAGLRTGNRRMMQASLGDHDWKLVQFQFEVLDPLYEVQLVCEARAAQGEALFDRSSLRLARLSPDE